MDELAVAPFVGRKPWRFQFGLVEVSSPGAEAAGIAATAAAFAAVIPANARWEQRPGKQPEFVAGSCSGCEHGATVDRVAPRRRDRAESAAGYHETVVSCCPRWIGRRARETSAVRHAAENSCKNEEEGLARDVQA